MSDIRQADLCDVCDQAATARWRGNRNIAICSTCAIDVLPKLMADAIDLSPDENFDRAKTSLERIVRTFWRAMACRLFREQKTK